MKKLLTVGDSFTYGDELSDPLQAWPYVLAQRLNYTVNNQGLSGCSNASILRRTLEELAVNKYDLVVIGWTIPGRIEWKDCDGDAYNMWPAASEQSRALKDRAWRVNLLKYITRYHNVEYLFQQYLIQVICLQSYFATRGIKYLMLNIKQKDRYRQVGMEYHRTLAAQVDQEHWVGWDKFGMAELAEGCEYGQYGHPLAAGHERIANEIYSRI